VSGDLTVYLLPAGRVPGIGPERGRRPRGPTGLGANGIACYVSPHGSYRYVYYYHGRPVSALQVVSRDGQHAAVARSVVGGFAADLIREARRKFKSVVHARDEMLSAEGRAWAGRVGDPRRRRR
jgi:hypothetical protein